MADADFTISDDGEWFCPALEKQIAHGLCWEYCFAGLGGPVDVADELRRWIEGSDKFSSLDDFHRVCRACDHCQWQDELAD